MIFLDLGIILMIKLLIILRERLLPIIMKNFKILAQVNLGNVILKKIYHYIIIFIIKDSNNQLEVFLLFLIILVQVNKYSLKTLCKIF
jgi:hypothetical protein